MNRLAAFAFACALCAAACARLDSFLYVPVKAPADGYKFGTSVIPAGSVQEISVKTSDGETLSAVYVKSSGAHPDITLLYFHGQSNNIGTAWPRVELLYPLGYNIEAVDPRGYGKSTGFPTEPGIHTDVLAFQEELIQRTGVDPKKIIIYGRSLGGAFAIDLAAAKPPGILIEESTFSSIQALVTDGAYADLPVGALADCRWDSLSKIAGIPSPFLAIHGTADDYVDVKYSKELAAAHTGTTRLLLVDGANHSTVPDKLGPDNYRQAIADFVAANLK